VVAFNNGKQNKYLKDFIDYLMMIQLKFNVMSLSYISKNQKSHETNFMQTASDLKKSKYRMHKISIVIIFLAGMLASQCSKKADSGTPQSLKESLDAGTQNLNTAVTAISKTYGYKVISLNDGSTLKSGPLFNIIEQHGC